MIKYLFGDQFQIVVINCNDLKISLVNNFKKKFFIFKILRCKTIQYPADLPTASVVFIFINERWSPILRSIYSIIHRSPKHLLKEIILVDDQSTLEELKQKLDDYCEEHFGDIVKILRPPKRLGLIAAKNYGIICLILKISFKKLLKQNYI